MIISKWAESISPCGLCNFSFHQLRGYPGSRFLWVPKPIAHVLTKLKGHNTLRNTIRLTTNNPYDKTVAHYRGDHYEGEGHSPEQVQVGPGEGGGRGTENIKNG